MGKWVRYGRPLEDLTDEVSEVSIPNENAKNIAKILSQHDTRWPIARAEDAFDVLCMGELHMFFGDDEDGEPTIPRAAIYTLMGRPTRAFGRGDNCQVEAELEEVVDAKINELGYSSERLSAMSDEEWLKDIAERRAVIPKDAVLCLSDAELARLHQIEERADNDPRRRAELERRRDIVRDLNKAMASAMQAAEKPKVFTLRDITSAGGLVIPPEFNGVLTFTHLTDARELVCPAELHRLYLAEVTEAAGIVLPKNKMDYLDLRSLRSAQGVEFPYPVESLCLTGLVDGGGLNLPPQYCGYVMFGESLVSLEGAQLPKRVRELHLGGLVSTRGLNLPETVTSGLFAEKISPTEPIIMPKYLREYRINSGALDSGFLIVPKNANYTIDDLRDGVMLRPPEMMPWVEPYQAHYLCDTLLASPALWWIRMNRTSNSHTPQPSTLPHTADCGTVGGSRGRSRRRIRSGC